MYAYVSACACNCACASYVGTRGIEISNNKAFIPNCACVCACMCSIPSPFYAIVYISGMADDNLMSAYVLALPCIGFFLRFS